MVHSKQKIKFSFHFLFWEDEPVCLSECPSYVTRLLPELKVEWKEGRGPTMWLLQKLQGMQCSFCASSQTEHTAKPTVNRGEMSSGNRSCTFQCSGRHSQGSCSRKQEWPLFYHCFLNGYPILWSSGIRWDLDLNQTSLIPQKFYDLGKLLTLNCQKRELLPLFCTYPKVTPHLPCVCVCVCVSACLSDF